MELFNRDFGDMSAGGVPADTRAIWVDEPETSTAVAFAMEVDSGRVAAARIFPSREAALEEVAG